MVAAPAYVHDDRTPATIWSMMSSTPGRSRVEVHAGGADALLEQLLARTVEVRSRSRVRLLHRPVRRHPEALLVQADRRCREACRRRIHGCRRATTRPSRWRRRRRARATTSRGNRTPAVGPDVCLPSRVGFGRALDAPRRTGGARRRSSCACRAHCARPDADLDDVGAPPRPAGGCPSAVTTLPATMLRLGACSPSAPSRPTSSIDV